jgi:polyisoprenyl-phosphate glycosyltransferase
MHSAIEVSVVIPVYRSQESLPLLVERLLAVLDGLNRTYEVVFVEDGSPDRSWQVLCQLQERHPDRLVIVQLMRNYGQHNALMCGFRRSRGRLVVTLDDDLQNPPEEIPRLIDALETRDLDLVYGGYGHKRHSGWRNAGSALVNAFYRLTFKSDVTVSSFRVIRRELLDSIFSYNLNYTFVDGLLAWNTQRIGVEPVEHHMRAQGRSGYNIGKLLLLALNLFTNFSLLPLQLVSACGFVAATVGLITALFYLARYLMHQIVVPGYASIIIAVLVLGGIQLLALGIMGEYLGRLHLNVNRKPQYVERQVIATRAAGYTPSDLEPETSDMPQAHSAS